LLGEIPWWGRGKKKESSSISAIARHVKKRAKAKGKGREEKTNNHVLGGKERRRGVPLGAD